MKVKEVIDQIISACSVPRMAKTCDQLIAGDWDCEVTGIATTFMATVDVVRAAIDQGINLIVTHEPTYFTHHDKTGWLQEDEVYRRKQRLIDQNGINIWRFHDHMHRTQPDLIFAGIEKELGWEAYTDSTGLNCYHLPKTTVAELSAFLQERLDVKIVQIVGSADDPVERLAFLAGGGSLGLGRDEMPMELMRTANLDAIVCGEILEWTLAAYVRDAHQLGLRKSLIILGHDRTEEVGMKHLVPWLQDLMPDVPVQFIESGEPFDYLNFKP